MQDKHFVAKVTQAGTNPPSMTIIRNELGGTPIWSYVSAGLYHLTLVGAFASAANVIFEAAYDVNGAKLVTAAVSDDVLSITALGDNLLTDTAFELVVYAAGANPAYATAIDLVLLSDVKYVLGIGTTHADTGKDTLLQRWITLVSEWFEGECNRKFQLQTITGEIQDGNGLGEIYPHWAPVYSFVTNDITQDVMVRDDPTASWAPLETTATKILLNPNEPWKIILYDNFFPLGVQNVKLNYKTGYAAVPAKIVLAAFDAVQILWHKSRQGDNRLMITSFSQNTAGSNFNTVYKDMSKESHDALNQFRRLV